MLKLKLKLKLKRKFRDPSDPWPRDVHAALKVGKSVPVLRPIAFRYAVSRIGGTPKPSYLTRKYRKHLKYPIQRKVYDLKQTHNWYRLTSRAEAVANTLHTLKPFRYVAVIERGQSYGGGEEGGWWYSYSNPVQIRRVAIWNAATALAHLERTGTLQVRGYAFSPSPADTDPMHDYDDAVDLIGATYGEGSRAEVSTRKPVAEPRSRPYYC